MIGCVESLQKPIDHHGNIEATESCAFTLDK